MKWGPRSLFLSHEWYRQHADETLSELLDDGRASIHETTSGDRYYKFRFDNDEQVEISVTCLDHIRMMYWDTIKGEYYARRSECINIFQILYKV